MSLQDQRSNLSTPLVGEASSTMGGDSIVGTLKGSCASHSISPNRPQLMRPTGSEMSPASSSSGLCGHQHIHHHHHSFTPQHYHNYYQQIGSRSNAAFAAANTIVQKNQRNKASGANAIDSHQYQQLALEPMHSKRNVSSDDSRENSVVGCQHHLERTPIAHNLDTTTSDSDYLASNLNLDAQIHGSARPSGGCCPHTCRCGSLANNNSIARDTMRPSGSQDTTVRTKKK